MDSEMPNKMKIKDEIVVSDIGSPKEERCLVSNPVMRIKNETTVCSDNEAENKIKIKEGGLMLDIGSPKEERLHVSDLVMNSKCETVVCSDSEMQREIKIKEEGLIGLENESFPSSDTMMIKNNSDLGRFLKVEIKEEHWWQESTSTEVKLQPESSFVSDFQVYSEIKEGSNEDIPATESTRSHTEAPPSTCSITPYLFSTGDLEEKEIEFPGASVHEVYGSGMLKTSFAEQIVHYHKSKISHDHMQSDKLKNCSSNKFHVCEICGKRFSQWNNLKAHILTHEGKKPSKCDVSDYSCTQKEFLVHQGKIPIKCELCEKSFTEKGHLKRHMLIHQGKKPFKCNYCEKSFTQKEHLNRHILIHQGKRPFKCDHCEKSYTQKESLNSHILIHQGKRPFKCDFCDKSFMVKRYLKMHILAHQGKRPFKCELCEKNFSQKGSLNRHMLIHQGKRPFKCDFCDKRFIEKGNLKKHILSHQAQLV